MKKFYALIAIVLFSGYIFAQSINQIGDVNIMNSINKVSMPEAGAPLKYVDNSQTTFKNSKGNSDGYGWFNYANIMQYVTFPPNGKPATSNLLTGILFPDTTILIRYSRGTGKPDSIGNPWVHSVGVVLDPYDYIFQGYTAINFPLYKQNDGTYKRFNTYTIDSVAIPYFYYRNIADNSIKDTLQIEVITNLSGPGTLLYGGTLSATWGWDSIRYIDLHTDDFLNYTFTQPTPTPNPPLSTPGVQIIKVPLGIADTTMIVNGVAHSKSKLVATNLNLAKDYGTTLSAVTFRFIPGYSWAPFYDTLNAVKTSNRGNIFQYFGYQENGAGEKVYPRYNKNYWNESEIYTTQSLRSDPPNAKIPVHNQYIPRLLYGLGGIDNINVGFHVHTTNLGISQNAEKNISLSQNIPNPAANSTIIPYELKSASNVTLVITDLAGNKVMELNEGKQMAGSQTIEINTANISSGMYFYTLNANNTKLTRKMIINK